MMTLIAAASLAVLTGVMPATKLSAIGHAQAETAVSPAQDRPAPVSDRAVKAAEPDFTLIGLPTTLRVPHFASAFRVTHRFRRALGSGSFGDLASDFFGLDSGAQIGLEYRFGILPATQIGIHRTSDRTIEFFLQRGVLTQGSRVPVTIDALLTAEGMNNFKHSYSPSFGAVISRTFGRVGAVYVEPIWVNNTNPLPSEVVNDNNTFMVGIGGRVRVRPTVYVVAEVAPRSGYGPDKPHASVALEKRVGGHSFQINFSNGFGTTMAQLARGSDGRNNWFMGFNISRKFF